MTNVFPSLPGLAIDVKRNVLTSTVVQPASSGKEQRASFWSSPRYEWELTFNFLRQASFSPNTSYDEAATLVAFFAGQGGQLTPFWFTDPYFSTATAWGFGTGNGTTTTFQLIDLAGVAVAPNGSVSVYVNGTLTTPSSISPTGLVTFSSAPANGAALTWTGSFYYTVRFSQDELNLKRIVNLAWEGGSLKLISVK